MVLLLIFYKINFLKCCQHQQNIFFENKANNSLIDQLTKIAY